MKRDLVRFLRLIPETPQARRADRSALGTLSTQATRYCDAVTSAAGYGWHVFAPMDFSLIWDGEAIYWTYGDAADWMPLEAAQFPNFAARFDQMAPAGAQGCSPPFLTVLPEVGQVQIWTGLMAKTAPGWSLLIRSPVNLPPAGAFSLFDGIVETDRWFGPLFTNLRLTRTHTPIRFRRDVPLAQVQPLPRAAYAERTLGTATLADELGAEEWSDYIKTIVIPNDDPDRVRGRDAVVARKRRRAECPFIDKAADRPTHNGQGLMRLDL